MDGDVTFRSLRFIRRNEASRRRLISRFLSDKGLLGFFGQHSGIRLFVQLLVINTLCMELKHIKPENQSITIQYLQLKGKQTKLISYASLNIKISLLSVKY